MGMQSPVPVDSFFEMGRVPCATARAVSRPNCRWAVEGGLAGAMMITPSLNPQSSKKCREGINPKVTSKKRSVVIRHRTAHCIYSVSFRFFLALASSCLTSFILHFRFPAAKQFEETMARNPPTCSAVVCFVLYWLNGVSEIESSPMEQHYVSPAQRSVQYGRKRRVVVSYNSGTPEHSRNLMVHADAYSESVDYHFTRIRKLPVAPIDPVGTFSTVSPDILPGSGTSGDESEFNLTSGYNEESGGLLNETATYVYTDSESDGEPDFHPLRIKAFLPEDEGAKFLTSEERRRLTEDILQPALLAWSAALRTKPVQGNLTLDSTQLLDGDRCGGEQETSVKVPQAHLVEGIPDADLVIYVQLFFTPEYSESRRLRLRGSDPQESTSAAPSPPELSVSPTTTSDEDTLPSTENEEDVTLPLCDGSYIGASSFCSTDQMDRPTASLLRLCIDPTSFAAKNVRRYVTTVMHEVAHIAGFNLESLARFRHPDGSPRTPRLDNGAVPQVEVECTGAEEVRRRANVSLPSEDVLKFRDVRGVRVAEIVTPTLRQVVRNHFGCQNLTGAELESGEPGSCIGDHLERRLFKDDLMNPVIDSLQLNSRISTILLAFFADSGWYQVDLSRATLSASWGRGSGCDFVERTCIADGEVPSSLDSFFCNDSASSITNIHGCTNDISRKASCALGQYDDPLPLAYQYFNSTLGPNVGGNDPFLDFCPVYSGFSNGLCSDAENEAVIRVNSIERFGFRNSRCISGNMGSLKTALCLPIACILEDKSFRIFVDDEWQECRRKDLKIISKSGDEVICPDPARICPTFFCRNDCLDSGSICDYSIGECVVPQIDHATENKTEVEPVNPGSQENPMVYVPPYQVIVGIPEDGTLSDYHFETKRKLEEAMSSGGNDSFFKKGIWWKTLALFSAATFIAGSFFVAKGKIGAGSNPDEGPDDNNDDDENEMEEGRNPDKLKAAATVVVDLRMRDQGHVVGRFHEALARRHSETDLSMTETDGGRTLSDRQLNLSFDSESNDMDANSIASEPECTIRHRRNGRHNY